MVYIRCFERSITVVILYVGTSEDMLVPTLVSALKGHHVLDVACGSGDAQTLAVTKDG